MVNTTSISKPINIELWLGVISLFPDMFRAITENGITSRAISSGLISLTTWNPRDFTLDRHRTVDDRPYGGGPGMLMKIQPLRDAIAAAKKTAGSKIKVIYLTPQGRLLDQKGVRELAKSKRLLLVAGRYEGVDERLIQNEIDEEWSIGDFVLTGGEIAAMALIDAISRFIPGTLGHKDSAQEDSFANGLLDCPHYTRPELFEGQQVPEVLLSGNHQRIQSWRLKESLGRTWLRRPDLLADRILTNQEQILLSEYINDHEAQK